MKSQIGYDIEFEEIPPIENTLNWCLMLRFMLDIFYKKSNLRKTVVIAITLLLGTSVLSGCTGDEDPLVDTWYSGDDMDGLQLSAGGSWNSLSEGVVDDDWDSTSWSVDGGEITLTGTSSYPSEDFTCADGSDWVPGSWVNDGEEDCADGSDEGVDTTGMDMDMISYTFVFRYVLDGDVMFVGVVSMHIAEDGDEMLETVDGEALCSSEDSDCWSFVRASAMNNILHATVVSGVDAPDWWSDTQDDCYDWDGDGVCDEDDAFPMDPEEHSDSDGDGIGDNADQD